MAQNVNKGNLYQAAERSGLSSAQKEQINSFADMYSKHSSLTNLPDAVAAIEYNQLSPEQQKSMAEFFGADETKPGQGAVMKAASWLVKPIVEPVKEVLKAASWASDQVTRAYRTGRIAIGENTDLASAFRRSGANGEQVYDESRISKAISTYGKDRVYVAQQISAGIPLDKIIANAQNPEQKRIAAEASKPDGDSLLDEAVAKVNAAKYSFGRDIANAFLPKDMEGKSGLYTWLSGTGDAAFRIFLDPTIVLGKVAKGFMLLNLPLVKLLAQPIKLIMLSNTIVSIDSGLNIQKV
jgi:hypothetical protein